MSKATEMTTVSSVPVVTGTDIATTDGAASQNTAVGSVPVVSGQDVGPAGYNAPTAGNSPSAMAATIATAAGGNPAAMMGLRPLRKQFRGGFSTSICGMFDEPSRRTDCCNIACCGILSYDRTQFALTGQRPNWCRRVLIFFMLPILVFFVIPRLAVAFYCPNADFFMDENNMADYEEDINEWKEQCQKASGWITGCLWGGLGLLLLLFVTSTVLRAWSRKDLLRRLQQERQTQSLQGQPQVVTDPSQVDAQISRHNCDNFCVHSLCGFVNDDTIYAQVSLDQYNAQEQALAGQDQALPPDFCSLLFRYFAKFCCFNCCQCWCQCLGACALGQEEREMERLVPKARRMFDYITFEHYANYFPAIEHLRITKDQSFATHFREVSQLSKRLLTTLYISIFVPTLYALAPPATGFTILHVLVLLATYCQAFIVLYVVHWWWHRFDLSVDAIIKYFAAGFLLSTTLAIVFATVVSIVVNLGVAILRFFELVAYLNSEGDLDSSNPESVKAYAKSHPVSYIVQYFFSSYLQAALVEELCKYFGYWMVEHPDFVSPQQLDESVAILAASTETNSLAESGCGGTLATEVGCSGSVGASLNNSLHQVFSTQQRTRSFESVAAGTTVAMVAVASGFACCENLLYIFLYSGTMDVRMEALVLLIRSLLPVHPLCAAIQSIGVCQRDVEGDRSVGVGRAILPAVSLHGTFDFVIMVMAFFSYVNSPSEEQNGDGQGDDGQEGDAQDSEGMYTDPDNVPFADIFASLFSSMAISGGVAFLGVIYYVYFANVQRMRLRQMDANRLSP